MSQQPGTGHMTVGRSLSWAGHVTSRKETQLPPRNYIYVWNHLLSSNPALPIISRLSVNLKNKAMVWQLHQGNSLPPAAGLLGHLSHTHSPTNTPSAPRNQPECHLRLSQGGFVELSFLEDQV